MSVMIVTSLGDIVVDLHTGKCPLTSKNFLKLCKVKYYNGCLFHTVQKDFIAQTGDPTGTGSGGDSVYKFLYGDQARFFNDEIHVDLKHSKTGTIAMASAGENLNASQFYITLRDDLDYLDGKHTVFGEVAEGLETLTRINEAYVDDKNRPYKNIRIKHTYVLDDPFEDPQQLAELIPDASPEGKPKDEVDDEVRLEDDWVPLDEQLGAAELEEVLRANEAHTRAVVLESVGDIPDADVKPPDNVLFVCKLNPVTEDEDLHTIFSRFGNVTSADIIRDFKTGDSLCYAFIEFDDKDACERAYFKMDNALIDDRRIHVDFSQSVSKLWNQYRRKDNHKGGEKGCFKCGAPDHMAKECTGDPSLKSQPAKYVLKDNNVQRGGADNSRFEMVFDEERNGSPRHKDKHGHHDKDDRIRPQKVHRSTDDIKYRERETDRPRESHRYRENKQEERRHEIRENRYAKEESDGKKEHEYARRDNKYPKRSDVGRDDGGYRKKMENEDRMVGRKEGRDGRRSIDDDDDDDGCAIRRDGAGHTNRSSDGEDYKRKRAEDDRRDRRRDEATEGKNDTYRRRREDSDGRHRASEERNNERRDEATEGKNDTYRWRREDSDGRHRASEERNNERRDRDRRYSSEKRR